MRSQRGHRRVPQLAAMAGQLAGVGATPSVESVKIMHRRDVCTSSPPTLLILIMATIKSAQRALQLGKGLVTLSKALSAGELTNTKVGAAFVASATAGALVYRYAWPWMQSENGKLRQVLEGGGEDPEHADQLLETSPPIRDEGVVTVYDPSAPAEPMKRRIRKGCRGKFIRELVAAVKLRLGTPKPTMANRRAVQRVAREELQEFNLRKTVAASIIPLVVEAVFVPSKWEVRAAEISNSCLAQARKAKMAVLLEMAGFQQA